MRARAERSFHLFADGRRSFLLRLVVNQEQERLESNAASRNRDVIEKAVRQYTTEFAATQDALEAAQKDLYVVDRRIHAEMERFNARNNAMVKGLLLQYARIRTMELEQEVRMHACAMFTPVIVPHPDSHMGECLTHVSLSFFADRHVPGEHSCQKLRVYEPRLHQSAYAASLSVVAE